VIQIYQEHSPLLTPPKIRQIYDETYSQYQEKQQFEHRTRRFGIFAIALLLIVLILFLWRKQLSLLWQEVTIEKVDVNMPFGIGGMQLSTRPVERHVAWSLYVELITRIALQPLRADEGLLREALTSLHSLFGSTRQTLKEAGPTLRVSPRSVGGIAINVLNQGLRPFLAKWHPRLEEWEANRPENTSRRHHEHAWPQASQLRQELEQLQNDLKQYAEQLAKIARI
jgi:hypothetical protein